MKVGIIQFVDIPTGTTSVREQDRIAIQVTDPAGSPVAPSQFQVVGARLPQRQFSIPPTPMTPNVALPKVRGK